MRKRITFTASVNMFFISNSVRLQDLEQTGCNIAVINVTILIKNKSNIIHISI